MKLQHNSSGESSEDLIALIIAVHRERRERERQRGKGKHEEQEERERRQAGERRKERGSDVI